MEYYFQISDNLKIPIYYRLKKLTSSQYCYIEDLINHYNKSNQFYMNSNNNNNTHNIIYPVKSIFSFSPSLDKLYVSLSSIYSLCHFTASNYIILVDSIDDVYKYYSLLNEIKQKNSNMYINKDKTIKKSNTPYIFPYLDKKNLCINEEALFKSSSLDTDYFCTSINTNKIECNYYFNSKINNKKLTIEYELDNYETKKEDIYNNTVPLSYYLKDNNIIYFKQFKICPYYFNLFNLENILLKKNDEDNQNKTKDKGVIIISTISSYFDLKQNNNLQQILANCYSINNVNNNTNREFNLVFDNFENINNYIKECFSINIDNNLLLNASKQIEILKKQIDLDAIYTNISFNNIKLDTNGNFNNLSINEIKPFEEIYYTNPLYNYLLRKYLNEDYIKNSSEEAFNYPGSIQNNHHFLNLLSRLIYVIRNILCTNENTSTNIISNNNHSPRYIHYLLLNNNFNLCDIKFLKVRLHQLILNEVYCLSNVKNNQNSIVSLNTITIIDKTINILKANIGNNKSIDNKNEYNNNNNNYLINYGNKSSFDSYYELFTFIDFLSIIELSTDISLCNNFNLSIEILDNKTKAIANINYINNFIIQLQVVNPGRLFDYFTSSTEEFVKNDYLLSCIYLSKNNLNNNKQLIESEDIKNNIIDYIDLSKQCLCNKNLYLCNNKSNKIKSYIFISNGITSDYNTFKAISFNDNKSYVLNDYNLKNNTLNLLTHPTLESIIVSYLIDYAYVSPENKKNLTHYSDNIIKICSNTSDGVICLFSSYSLLQNYLYLWNLNGKENSLFNTILNDKLIFVEDIANNYNINNNHKLIYNYKVAVNSGRGGILFASLRNNLHEYLIKYNLRGKYSKTILFFGLPLEPRFNNSNFLNTLDTYKILYNMNKESYIYYDCFKSINDTIVSCIEDIDDRKFIVFFDDKMLCYADASKGYCNWLCNRLEIDNNNSCIEDKIKNLSL